MSTNTLAPAAVASKSDTEFVRAGTTDEQLRAINEMTNEAICHHIGGGYMGAKAILGALMQLHNVSKDQIVGVLKLKESMSAKRLDTRMVGVIGKLIGWLEGYAI